MTDWSRQLGEKRGSLDRAASVEMQTLVDRDNERHTECLQRWPTIVAAMRTLVATYNDGAGVPVLTLVEDSATPSVALESARSGRGALVMTLDGADVCVRTRHTGIDATSGVRWVTLNRTDEEAAEYLLRNWMEHL
jgi:hypothetical protein